MKTGSIRTVVLLPVFLLFLISLVGARLLSLTIPLGLGLGNDSVSYIAGARSLEEGNGYRRIYLYSQKPITHFPPLFSLVLAAGSFAGSDPLYAANGIIISLYVLNTLLVGLCARKMAAFWVRSESWIWGVLAAGLFAANANLLEMHRYVMSEPLYLALSLLFFLLIANYFQTLKYRWLVLTGLVCGLAFLTRYVGLAILLTAGLGLLLFEENWKRRFRGIGILLLTASPLILSWIFRNMLLSGSATNRMFTWHPISWEKIQFGIDHIWAWLLPGRLKDLLEGIFGLSAFILAIIFLLGLFGLIWIWPKINQREDYPKRASAILSFLIIAYTYCYLGFMLISMSIFDAATTFENRILAPVFVTFILLFVFMGAWMWQNKSPYMKIIVIGMVLLVGSFFVMNQIRMVQSTRYDSEGFASRIWVNSETLSAVRELPSDLILYTNSPTLLYIRTNRQSNTLPTPLDTALNQLRPNYLAEVAKTRKDILDGKGAIVILGWGWQEEPNGLSWYHDLTDGLRLAVKYTDGEIFVNNP